MMSSCYEFSISLRDFRLLPRSRRDLCSSGLLCSITAQKSAVWYPFDWKMYFTTQISICLHIHTVIYICGRHTVYTSHMRYVYSFFQATEGNSYYFIQTLRSFKPCSVIYRCNESQQNAHFLHYCFNLTVVPSTCFKHPIVHPQEDVHLQFYGFSVMHPYKQQSGRW
jgi:hypothetical protein